MTAPTLNSLELLGLLSARLTHALSNQLVIITGNICAAARPQSTSPESLAALQAALTATNATGNLLNDFADFRRRSADALGEMRAADLEAFLESWCRPKRGWTYSVSGDLENQILPLSSSFLRFAFDAVHQVDLPCSGDIRCLFERNSIQVVMRQQSSNLIDWDAVRSEIKPVNLAVASEILGLIGAKPSSRISRDAAETAFRIPARG